jgi:hypothetical protein
MNTEAIIEKLLLSQEGQILNTPLEDLNLPIRVYKRLRRSNIRTVGDVAHAWNCFPKVRRIGGQSRAHILGALQAWSRSIPDTSPADAEGHAQANPKSPIEVLHLSARTYCALKRNRIETVADIYREWDRIVSLRSVGPKTRDEIQTSLAAVHLSEGLEAFGNLDGMGVDRKEPTPPSHPSKNDCTDRSTASAPGHEPIDEFLTKKHVITDSGFIVSVDLLQEGEPRKTREERWRNVSREQVSAKPQNYLPKSTFQAIGEGQNKISTPVRRPKKPLDGSVPIATEWIEMSLYLLEKARTSRQLRTINCPICMARTLSIRFEEHLVDLHPQAYLEVKKAAKGSHGRQLKKHLVDTYTQAFQDMKEAAKDSPGGQIGKSAGLDPTDPSRETPTVKCPLCEHTAQYILLRAHIAHKHPEIDPGPLMTRFNKVHMSTDYENLSRYRDELNELVKEYEWLKRAQDEPRESRI